MAAALARFVRILALCLIGSALGGLAQAQQIKTLTNTESGGNRIPLGFPVPRPQDTPLPFDGFRSYQGLLTRAQDLLLISPRLAGEVAGQTLQGRDIWVYRVGDADRVGAEGRPEPAVMINGGIHAREWQSPEVVTGLLESLVEAADSQGLDRFLLDEVNLVVVPVLNVDGFLVTQADPDRIWEGQDPTDLSWPRDGRMRRKNLRNSDGVFSTSADHRGGVDLNRNNAPYWASSSQSHSLPESLIYHGVAAASEPEIQALLQAAHQAPREQMRVYVDAHSFGLVLFTIRTGNARRNNIMAQLAADFSTHHRAVSTSRHWPAGRNYADRPDFAGTGIGQTAEYFANSLQIPAWTLEIEPGNPGAAEYGGFGYHHDGFILPEREIRRVREQLSQSHRVLLYHAAGPASLAAVQVRAVADGSLLHDSRWQALATDRRQLQQRMAQGLRPGQRHQLWLAFDRPMRERVDGASRVLPGQASGLLQPTVALLSGGQRLELPAESGRWLSAAEADGRSFDRYREDAWVVEFDLPADFPAGPATLEVDATDLIGRRLDAWPATPVGWSGGHWTGYDTSAGNEADSGGVDRSQSIWVAAGAQIAVRQDALQLSEGGSVWLHFERLGDPNGAASLDLAFAPSEGLLASSTRLLWADGELGSRSVAVSALDDLQVGGDKELFVAVQGSLPTALSELRLSVLDNDTPELRRASIGEADHEQDAAVRATRLAALLVEAQGTGAAVELQLAAGDYRFDEAAAGSALGQLGSLGGDLRIAAKGSHIDLAGRHWPLVANGASLQIDGARLQGRQAAGNPMFASNGLLILRDCVIEGSDGVVIRSEGELRLDRCGAVDLQGPLVQMDGGTATLKNLTLGGPASTLWQQNAGSAEWTHVSLAGASPNPVSVASGALLQLRDSLLSVAAGGDGCRGFYSSLGGNVLGGPDCVAGSDADLRLSAPVIAALDPATATAVPVVTVEASVRSCPQRDQLGVARGDSCLPGARAAGVAFPRGLWWNPQRPGHGQHITIVQDVLFMLWYTYDAQGLPVTWTAQGQLVNGQLLAPLLQWRREAVTELPRSEQIGGVDLRVIDAGTVHLGWGLNDGSGSGFEVLTPFRFDPAAPQSPRTGLYADNEDLGWGLTLQEEGGTAFALLYYFAADDRLRWASAQGMGGLDLRLPSLAQTGQCLFCGEGASIARPSGELRLRAMGPNQLQFSGAVSSGVAPSGSWIRQATLERFDAY